LNPKPKHLFRLLPYFLPLALILILYVLGFRFVVPLTDSMSPSIPPGSLVVTAPTWIVKPSPGSVILYRVNLSGYVFLVLHRVLSVEGSTLRTKGDARSFADPWLVRSENVEGVAIFSVPLLGWILLALKPAAILAAAGIASYYAASYAVKRVCGEGRCGGLMQRR